MKVEDKTHEFNLETLIPEYFNKDALKTEPRKIYRLDIQDDRQYYTLDENGIPTFYHSVTSVIKRALPTSPFLIDWMIKMGKAEAEAYRDERAAFGTLMHSLFATILIDRTLDINAIETRLENYLEINRHPAGWRKWGFEMKSACMAFAQWCIDYEVKPIAIELALASDRLGIAGMVDLPCEITIEEIQEVPKMEQKREVGFWGEVYKANGKDYKAGDPKQSTKITEVQVMKKEKVKVRKRAIVDFKSGKNFFEEHEIQLCMYRDIWNENFPEDPLHLLFNWAPNEWRGTTPTYKFKEQTHSRRIAKLGPIIQLSKIEQAAQDRKLTILSGCIDLDKGDIGTIREIDYFTAVMGDPVKTEPEPRPGDDIPNLFDDAPETTEPTLFDEVENNINPNSTEAQ